MKVRLTTSLFESDIYSLSVSGNRLIFSCSDQEIQIVIPEIQRFTAEGSGTDLKWFSLETNHKTYEGLFLQPGDGENFLLLLREKLRCHIDILLDARENN